MDGLMTRDLGKTERIREICLYWIDYEYVRYVIKCHTFPKNTSKRYGAFQKMWQKMTHLKNKMLLAEIKVCQNGMALFRKYGIL